MDDLDVGPPQHKQAWHEALHEKNDTLLAQLVENEPPGVVFFAIAAYINALYKVVMVEQLINQKAPTLRIPLDDFSSNVQRVQPFIQAIRKRLGWQQRELDIGLMRWIRRSSALSIVIGAGVTKDAGGPLWSELVRLLLNVALKRGHEITQMVPTADSPAEPPIRFLPDGNIQLGEGTWSVERKVIRVERFETEVEEEARHILALIEARQEDIETLMRGAQLCYNLFGQELFTHITGIIYSRAKEPSSIHHAIAELAHGQSTDSQKSKLRSGWDSIISYNFDDLMGEALGMQQIPHAAFALTKAGVRGDPDQLAQKSDWYQPIYHLHGYTPRRPFLITDTEFVFSTSQYTTIYKGQRELIDYVMKRYLAYPVHVALYVGCSFSDDYMNQLLREAAKAYPGRSHYALLKWPGGSDQHDPTGEEIEEASRRYLDFGIQPVWVREYKEIPSIIGNLK